jgi:hypothetical protein
MKQIDGHMDGGTISKEHIFQKFAAKQFKPLTG